MQAPHHFPILMSLHPVFKSPRPVFVYRLILYVTVVNKVRTKSAQSPSISFLGPGQAPTCAGNGAPRRIGVGPNACTMLLLAVCARAAARMCRNPY